MSASVARLRRFVPLVVFVVTVGLGWTLLAYPALADGARTDDRIAVLRQRIASLQSMVTEPSPSVVTRDPLAAFDERVGADDPTASIVERLARLASDTRARGLFIETVEGAGSTGTSAAPVAATYQPDPRFALFDRQLRYTTIRMSFETDYADLGRFLWNLRELPSLIEIRTLTVQPRAPGPTQSNGTLRASMTLFAYSRTAPPQTAAVAVTP